MIGNINLPTIWTCNNTWMDYPGDWDDYLRHRRLHSYPGVFTFDGFTGVIYQYCLPAPDAFLVGKYLTKCFLHITWPPTLSGPTCIGRCDWMECSSTGALTTNQQVWGNPDSLIKHMCLTELTAKQCFSHYSFILKFHIQMCLKFCHCLKDISGSVAELKDRGSRVREIVGRTVESNQWHIKLILVVS